MIVSYLQIYGMIINHLYHFDQNHLGYWIIYYSWKIKINLTLSFIKHSSFLNKIKKYFGWICKICVKTQIDLKFLGLKKREYDNDNYIIYDDRTNLIKKEIFDVFTNIMLIVSDYVQYKENWSFLLLKFWNRQKKQI